MVEWDQLAVELVMRGYDVRATVDCHSNRKWIYANFDWLVDSGLISLHRSGRTFIIMAVMNLNRLVDRAAGPDRPLDCTEHIVMTQMQWLEESKYAPEYLEQE